MSATAGPYGQGEVAASVRERLQDAITGRSIALAVIVGAVAGFLLERVSFAVGATAGTCLVLVVAVRRTGLRWADLRGELPAGSWWRIPAVTAGLFLASVAALYLVWYPIALVDEGAVEAWLNEGGSSIAEHGLFSTAGLIEAFTIIVLAPASEELLFRGVALRHGPGRARRASILWSSAIFGLLHFPEVLGAAVHGLVLSLYTLRTRGLAFAILCHALNNAAVAVLVATQGVPAPETSSVEDFRDWAWLGVVALAISVPWLVRLLGRSWHELAGQPAPATAAT